MHRELAPNHPNPQGSGCRNTSTVLFYIVVILLILNNLIIEHGRGFKRRHVFHTPPPGLAG